MIEHAFQPGAFIGIYHLTVFGHDYVGRFIAILPHVISPQVKRSSCQDILCQGYIAEYVFALSSPGNDFALTDSLILSIVYFQTIEIVITSKKFSIHHSPEIQIRAAIGIGGDVSAVIGQQETDTGIEILVSFVRSSGCFVRRFVHQIFGWFRDVVVIYIYLRSGEYVAVAQAEQEPGVELDAAVAILTGSVAPDIILVRAVAQTIEVIFRILVGKLSEDAETVTFKKELGFGEKVDTAIEEESDGYGNHGAQLCGVTWVHAEGHQGASTEYGTKVGGVTRTTQNVVVQISLRYLLFS